VKFTDVPSFPIPTVTGHSGEIIKGKYGDKDVVIWAGNLRINFALKLNIWLGRIHRYEGYATYEMNLISEISASLGCQWIINTNAAGGAIKGISPGSLMIITDHYNGIGCSPLKSNSLNFILN
jgi:purine-nucleoside phosphorylase